MLLGRFPHSEAVQPASRPAPEQQQHIPVGESEVLLRTYEAWMQAFGSYSMLKNTNLAREAARALAPHCT